MPVDYDLIIIGATATARAAAIAAVNLQARVALVIPFASTQYHPQCDLYLYALSQIATSSRTRPPLQQPASYPWKYALAAIDRLEQQSSLPLLAAMGVDPICGDGEFCRHPQLAFKVGKRSLSARAYLLATGAVSATPLIPGIQEVGYVVRDRLPELVDRQIPLRWAIIGTEAVGVELAQTLARLGCQVSLIVDTTQILPYEDREIATSIQAQLEADGVDIYLDTVVMSVCKDTDTKVLTCGAETIVVDEIFVALPDRPVVEPFNLGGVGVNYDSNGISIDNQLQTAHPQIYACGNACGNVTGGYRSDSLARYEAQIAVRNALRRSRVTKIDFQSYNSLPWAVYTDPPLARVGTQASNRPDEIVLRQDLKVSAQAILTNITSGYCQIVVSKSGRILGANIVGQNAPELIQVLALAIQQKLNISQLIDTPSLSPSWLDFIYDTAKLWDIYRSDYRRHRHWWQRCWDWLQQRLLH